MSQKKTTCYYEQKTKDALTEIIQVPTLLEFLTIKDRHFTLWVFSPLLDGNGGKSFCHQGVILTRFHFLQLATQMVYNNLHQRICLINKNHKQEELASRHQVAIIELMDNDDNVNSINLVGFISFAIEHEIEKDIDSPLVFYLYEIQVSTRWQGKGLGKWLLAKIVHEQLLRQHFFSCSIDMVMLTVHRKNHKTRDFYRKVGDYRVHPSSPSNCDYEILYYLSK